MILLWAMGFGLAAGFLGGWGMIRFSRVLHLEDAPIERSSHSSIIPKGAGMGLMGAFGMVSIFLEISPGFWLPVILVSLVSFWGGDKQKLSAGVRLVLQFGCAWIFVLWLLSSRYPMTGFVWVLGIAMSVFVVGTANFYNFMDGIDGIAGITGVVAFGLLLQMISTIHPGSKDYGVLCLTMACACLGFLYWNFPKARIFMGDVGSVPLGFLLAAVMLIMSRTLLDLLVMAGFLMPFYLDELFTMGIRMQKRESLAVPHRRHVYQLLVNELGISHWKVSLSYGIAQAVIGETAIALSFWGMPQLLSFYAGMGVLFMGAGCWIHHKAGKV